VGDSFLLLPYFGREAASAFWPLARAVAASPALPTPAGVNALTHRLALARVRCGSTTPGPSGSAGDAKHDHAMARNCRGCVFPGEGPEVGGLHRSRTVAFPVWRSPRTGSTHPFTRATRPPRPSFCLLDGQRCLQHTLCMKRTNLVLDEHLLEEANRLSGLKTYSKTVEVALLDFVRRAKARQILSLRGSGVWQGDLAEMRRDPVSRTPGSRRAAKR
jgi:Arc/MetJ family transcription regulator